MGKIELLRKNPSIHPSIYLSIYYQSIYLAIYLASCLSIQLAVYLSIYLSIYLSTNFPLGRVYCIILRRTQVYDFPNSLQPQLASTAGGPAGTKLSLIDRQTDSRVDRQMDRAVCTGTSADDVEYYSPELRGRVVRLKRLERKDTFFVNGQLHFIFRRSSAVFERLKGVLPEIPTPGEIFCKYQ